MLRLTLPSCPDDATQVTIRLGHRRFATCLLFSDPPESTVPRAFLQEASRMLFRVVRLSLSQESSIGVPRTSFQFEAWQGCCPQRLAHISFKGLAFVSCLANQTLKLEEVLRYMHCESAAYDGDWRMANIAFVSATRRHIHRDCRDSRCLSVL